MAEERLQARIEELASKGYTVIKKNGTREPFDAMKIIVATGKSAKRIEVKFSEAEKIYLLDEVEKRIELKGLTEIPVPEMHIFVENALRSVSQDVAESYCRYRDHHKEYAEFMSEAISVANEIQHNATDDENKNENANSNDTLVSTKRCLIFNEFNKRLYHFFFLTKDELEATKDGYIYIHDMSARRDTMNCCLFDLEAVLEGGFYSAAKGGMWYNQPKSLDTFGDVVGDVVLMAASQQYGGFTVCSIDQIMEPYAEKTYQRIYDCQVELLTGLGVDEDKAKEAAEKTATETVLSQIRGCFQGWEYKFNTVASSRGDYPFITFTYGLARGRWGREAAKICSQVRAGGQGRHGVKKPVLFPKLVFLYDENLHKEGCELADVFEEALKCSSKSMYPDFLSLTGDGGYGEVPYMYKNYGVVTHPMGCRAFLSPWFERGGMYAADDEDKPITVGRFNIGAVSLHLPMIWEKAKLEGRDFYEVLDYYLEMIRGIHLRTYDYLAELKASSNPLAFMEGGFYGGHLKANESIKPLLASATASFGITALNELEMLAVGKGIKDDSRLANEVMDHIKEKLAEFKEEDGRLYAIYGTPAESLCGKQVIQFRKKYGIIPGVSDRAYVSNSFHCHVSEHITPPEKQDYEYSLFHKFAGGRIQYVKYPIGYNIKAIRTLIERAMELGYYEGVNMDLCYCEECGWKQESDFKICPRCGSKNVSMINRMNGYLGWTQTGNQDTENARKAISTENLEEILKSVDTDAECDTRFSIHKNAEFLDRVSM